MDVLNIDFDLPFDEAIEWGENRVSVLPQFFYGVLQAQARAQAFTVSGLTALQQIQDTLDRLNDALANGMTLADWKKTVNAETFALGKWRMETIFRTHVQTCYSIGRTQQHRENAAHRPFLMYDAINDSRTRPNHTALDNFIAPLNDPIWKKITPPNGFNCRCTTIALTEAQAIKRGWKGFTEYRDKGEPDKGWDYNPADSHDANLDALMEKRLAEANPIVAAKMRKLQPPVAPIVPKTIEEFIKAGRSVTDLLPDGAIAARECHAALLELLEREVGISTPCKTASSGDGAKLVKEASKLYPDSWTGKSNDFGPLYTKAKANTRGHALTTVDPPKIGNRYKLADFGVVTFEQNAGYVMVRKDDIGNAVHEYGHRLQKALPGLDKLFQELHTKRVAGQEVKRLKDLLPGANYGPLELTREDHYINPYQGKEYATTRVNGKVVAQDGGAFEVMTMAFETVLGLKKQDSRSRVAFEDMYTKDRELFDFVVGLLRHWTP